MKVLVRHTVLILFMWLMLAGVCLGKQVYLKDGSIIESRSAWQQGNKVFVKVNRDIVADFNSNEIDLRRTFPKAASPASHVQRRAAPAMDTKAAESALPVPAAVKPDSKPVVPPKPAVAAPAPKPAASPANKPATVAKESSQPGAAVTTATEPAAPPDKTEQQRRAQEAAKMMVDAAMKKDPEMMKKALEIQKSSMAQRESAVQNKSFPISFLLIILLVCLLVIAGQWVVFQKAGQAGWKSLIPFYNMYVLMEISGKPGWWMFLLIIPLVGVAILLFALLSLAKKFGRSELFGVGLLFLPMIFFPLLAFGGSEYEG